MHTSLNRDKLDQKNSLMFALFTALVIVHGIRRCLDGLSMFVIRMYACVHVWMCACLQICVSMHASVAACVHVCTCACVPVGMERVGKRRGKGKGEGEG